MKTLIVIPTYNESQNIERLIRSIFQITSNCFEAHVLVVDDNSPDGTATIVEKLSHTDYAERLFLIVRDCKRGLGTAYIQGFRWGIKYGYYYLIEMDADFSHNPIYLPKMMQETDRYDCIVGSRYAGGEVKGWGPLRRIISKGGALYAKLILSVPVHDLTGGFNVWKRNVLEAVDLSNIKSEGYVFQIELKYRALKKGFRLLEFPIIFEDRLQGTSKLSKKIIFEAIYRVWQLKFMQVS